MSNEWFIIVEGFIEVVNLLSPLPASVIRKWVGNDAGYFPWVEGLTKEEFITALDSRRPTLWSSWNWRIPLSFCSGGQFLCLVILPFYLHYKQRDSLDEHDWSSFLLSWSFREQYEHLCLPLKCIYVRPYFWHLQLRIGRLVKLVSPV